MKREGLLGVLLFCAAAGCSEAKDDSDGEGGSGTGGAAQSTGSETSTGSEATGSVTSSGATGGSVGDVVINEVSATEDWIELFNPGTAAADIGGITLADQDTPGVPKLDEAIQFPAGTSIAPGAYLFILVKQDTATPGQAQPQTMCAPGPSPCFHAPFGLSDTDGDAVFLLQDMTPLAVVNYPPATIPDGQSYCRLPNGNGDFAACAPTPGATNAAP
jgi:hypothetical protein